MARSDVEREFATVMQDGETSTGLFARFKAGQVLAASAASFTVDTDFATIYACGACESQANTATLANYAVSITVDRQATAGKFTVYRWKHTGSTTPTLVAATTAGTVDWWAIGV